MAFLKSWVKLCLFLISYFPLFIIMGILHYDHPIIPYVAIACSLVGFGGTFITFGTLNRISGQYKKANNVKPAAKMNFQYFLAYIIPFIAMDVDSTRQIIAYLVLFVFIGILYVRTELLYVNPTLTLLGYNILKIKTDEENIMLITRNDFENTLNNPVILIDRDLYFEQRSRTSRK